MKTYQITVNGKTYQVKIDDPNASPATVEVNGKKFTVEIAEPKTTPAAAKPEEALFAPDYAPTTTPTFVDTSAAMEQDLAEPTAASAAPSGDTITIIAPMPGKILDITVQVGQQIKNGDTLCNLEAMKMKSPIRSTADGTIAQILVSEGKNVQYGDALFTLG